VLEVEGGGKAAQLALEQSVSHHVAHLLGGLDPGPRERVQHPPPLEHIAHR